MKGKNYWEALLSDRREDWHLMAHEIPPSGLNKAIIFSKELY